MSSQYEKSQYFAVSTFGFLYLAKRYQFATYGKTMQLIVKKKKIMKSNLNKLFASDWLPNLSAILNHIFTSIH